MLRKRNVLMMVLCFLLVSVTFIGCGNMSGKASSSVETYPSHQIELIVPFGPGGGTDLHARALQKVAAKYLKQPLVVINKPGGGTIIGFDELVRSAPDGYTWGISVPEVIFHSVYGTSKYHYLTALEPVAQISSTPQLLLVNANSSWQSVSDVIKYAKDNKKPIKFASGGLGSASHVLGEIFGRINGIETLQVPFHGGSEKVAMLLGNHVDVIYNSPSAVKEFVENNKLRALATTGSKRLKDPLFADIPTLKELGIDIEFNDWYGIVTPKPLPLEIKKEIAEELKKMILDPDFQENIKMLGTQLDYLGPEECQKKWIEDTQRLKKMVIETGIMEQVREIQGKPIKKEKS